jgi:hypothetical protein
MTEIAEWHPEGPQLADYANGRLSGPRGSVIGGSIEAHLIACESCRTAVAAHVPEQRLSTVWNTVRERVDAPKRSLIERLMTRCGLPEADVRVLLATPTLRLAWLAGMVATLGFGVWAAHARGGNDLPFLLVAPLLPVLGVASAFTPRLDPAYDVARAASYSAVRLVLVRSVAVVTATIVLGFAAALALPVLSLAVAAWLLPALSLTCVVLAIATWWEPQRAAAIVAAGWVVAVVGIARESTDPLAAFGASGQVAVTALGIAALVVFIVRHNSVDAWSSR